MNRRGIDMSIQTIVMLVIALIVLFLVSVFFTGGFKNLSQKFSGFHGEALSGTEEAGESVGEYIGEGEGIFGEGTETSWKMPAGLMVPWQGAIT